MLFHLSDKMISDFMNGLLIALALVVAGCLIALILSGMSRRFPFSRLALTLAVTPLIFARFLEYTGVSTLHLYAMIVVLLGITIDGINHLLKPRVKSERQAPARPEEASEQEEGRKPRLSIWKKAE